MRLCPEAGMVLLGLYVLSPGFATVTVILPVSRCRKFMAPHPSPLVQVDGATLVSRCIS